MDGILNGILTSMNKFDVGSILISVQDDHERMSTTVNQLTEKHQVDSFNSEIDNKNKKIKQLIDQKNDTMNHEMLNKERSIGEIETQRRRKDIELKCCRKGRKKSNT